MKPSAKGKRYIGKIFQSGVMVASVDAPTIKQADKEIEHYSFMYGLDGPVRIKRYEIPSKPKGGRGKRGKIG